MLTTFRTLLAVALLTGTTAWAQSSGTGGTSYTGVASGANYSQPSQLEPNQDTAAGSAPSDKLFNDPPPEDGGWKGLARLLEALEPSVDTSIPLSASQITDRIAAMLDNNQNAEALAIIEKREQQLQNQLHPGSDVQLLFLRARALAALGQQNEAIAAYRNLTVLYPELPEPWNNLASEYVKQGKLAMAHDALTMALTADPHYSTARTNLSEVLQMQARQLLQ